MIVVYFCRLCSKVIKKNMKVVGNMIFVNYKEVLVSVANYVLYSFCYCFCAKQVGGIADLDADGSKRLDYWNSVDLTVILDYF